MPEAEVALTHDDDWRALLYDNDEVFPERAELLRRLKDKYTIASEAGSVYLVPKETWAQRTAGCISAA